MSSPLCISPAQISLRLRAGYAIIDMKFFLDQEVQKRMKKSNKLILLIIVAVLVLIGAYFAQPPLSDQQAPEAPTATLTPAVTDQPTAEPTATLTVLPSADPDGEASADPAVTPEEPISNDGLSVLEQLKYIQNGWTLPPSPTNTPRNSGSGSSSGSNRGSGSSSGSNRGSGSSGYSSGSGQRATSTPIPATASRTLMYYAVGSNLESESRTLTRDIEYILSSGMDPDEVNVILCLGGTTYWHSERINLGRGQVAIYQVVRSGSGLTLKQLTSPSKRDMGSPETLTWFLKTAYQTCPARAYVLCLDDHGGGPLGGFGHDTSTDNMMTLKQIVSALSNSPFGKKKLEGIWYNCCLMGTVEVARAMAPYAEYMVASADISWDCCYTFNFLQSRYVTGPALDFYDAIARDYINRASRHTSVESMVSVLRLNYIGDVTSALNSYFNHNYRVRDVVSLARISPSVRFYGTWGRDYKYDLMDVYGFAEKVGSRQLMNAVSNCVYSCYDNGVWGHNGLAFYFPYYALNRIQGRVRTYGGFSSSIGLYKYKDFLDVYSSNVNAVYDGLVSNNSGAAIPGSSSAISCAAIPGDEATAYTMTLTPSLQDTYLRAYYNLVALEEDDTYRLVESGYGLDAQGDTLTLTHDGLVRNIHVGGESTEFTIIEDDRYDGAVRFSIPMVHMRGTTVTSVYAMYQERAHWPQGEIATLMPVQNTEAVGAVVTVPEAGDQLVLAQMTRILTRDEEGKLLPFNEWTAPAEQQLFALLNVDESGVAITREERSENVSYYIQLCVVDVYGQTHASELLPVE